MAPEKVFALITVRLQVEGWRLLVDGETIDADSRLLLRQLVCDDCAERPSCDLLGSRACVEG
jgi:hypothetical protein